MAVMTAALPMSGFAALQAVRDRGEVADGDRVLVIGASGGVGSFAVQIAKSLGAETSGGASTRNLDLVRQLGGARPGGVEVDAVAGDVAELLGNHQAGPEERGALGARPLLAADVVQLARRDDELQRPLDPLRGQRLEFGRESAILREYHADDIMDANPVKVWSDAAEKNLEMWQSMHKDFMKAFGLDPDRKK